MKTVSLLDCTLRDGGYINDWNYGYNCILTIFNRLNNANIDIIEIGFLDDRNIKNLNRTINPSTKIVDEQFASIKNKKSMVVAMIDYGTCSLENISEPNFIDGIRVIFKKKDIDGAIEFCKKIKEKGYKVFIQPVSITGYSDIEMLNLVEKVNKVNPYAMSIVDTYGLMHKNNMIKYFYIMDSNLNPDIKIGYHSHNNFQLAYANTIEFIEAKTSRSIIVDASLYGMGKSAGNTCIELLAMYLNNEFNKDYDINEILEAIDLDIIKYKNNTTWGYSLPFYISALNQCHPNYVEFLRKKCTLSIKSINEILGKITKDKKLLFDKNYIENLYIEYQKKEIDDSNVIDQLKNQFKDKTLLLLGPGSSIVKEKNKIIEYINKNNPIIVGVNHIPSDYKIDYLFISNTKRYEKYANILINKKNNFKIIATSNISAINNEFDFVFNYGKLLNNIELIEDNSMSMFVTALIRMNIKKLSLAGFDGFKANESNYYDNFLSFSNTNQDAQLFNEAIIKQLNKLSKFINIEFITDSIYANKY